jgi:hypothetical protein
MNIIAEKCKLPIRFPFQIVILILFLLSMENIYSQIIFNEIMFDAAGSDYHDEFVELFNLSFDDTINLQQWSIRDSLYSDVLTDAGYGMNLAPRQFAIVHDKSYFGNSNTYENLIPDSALIITISDRAFTKSGFSNSKGKTLFLYNQNNTLIQKYLYSVDNLPGFSDEKIDIYGDNSIDNWGNSIKINGTPGFHNSITPYDKDLGFAENGLQYMPTTNIKIDQDIKAAISLQNYGVSSFADSLQIDLFLDRNRDSIYNNNDIMIYQKKQWIDIQTEQQKMIDIVWQTSAIGKFLLVSQIYSSGDQNSMNNNCVKPIVIVDNKRSIKISEIKFLTNEGEDEWIELYNAGDRKISMMDWAFADKKDTVFIDTLLYIHPGQYKVFTGGNYLKEYGVVEDSLLCICDNFPVLNNDEDIVYLINPAGGWEEQVPYESDWLEGESWCNPSLERISFFADSRYATNWGPATNEGRSTPAMENSIHQVMENSAAELTVTPNPFSPDGDGFEDHCIISVSTSASLAKVEITIFDIMGRKVRKLEDGSVQGSNFNLIWNGRDESGKIVRVGIYIILVRIIDDKNGLIVEKKVSVVAAAKL